jgi:antitoxin component YwqK of YwqJK toxin-antitoxin module
LLHGVVRLYYRNGQLQKEQNFVHGKLKERERLWNERGELKIDIIN